MSYCIIDSKKFSSNIKVVSNYVSIDKIAFVLKNNAYGHGLLEMAQLAKDNNIRHAAVINYNEAQKIQKYFSSILVLSSIPKKCPPRNIHIAINDISDIYKMPSKTNVELKSLLKGVGNISRLRKVELVNKILSLEKKS